MKAIYHTGYIDNEAIKAIRFVMGFNTNLRVSLPNADKDAIWRFLDEHRYGIFGSGIEKPDPTSIEWETYETRLNEFVRKIVR